MLTADTITDEQIHGLLIDYLYAKPLPDSYGVDLCDLALGRQSRYRRPDPACKPDADAIRRARARVAEILTLSEPPRVQRERDELRAEVERLRFYETTSAADAIRMLQEARAEADVLRQEIRERERAAEVSAKLLTDQRDQARADCEAAEQRLLCVMDGTAKREIERLRVENARLHEAIDELRHSIDGYDQTFAYANWIALGRPGEFSEWLEGES